MARDPDTTPDQARPASRFRESAAGFGRGRSAEWVWTLKGVNGVAESFEAKTVVATFDNAKVQTDDLIASTTNAGYLSHLSK